MGHSQLKLRKYRKVLPIALKRKLFQAFVLPHADYCAVVRQECNIELQIKVDADPKLWFATDPITASQDT